MLVSYKWLKELVDVPATPKELSEKMSTSGIEVEGVESRATGLKNLVVGYVESTELIPDTHLTICQVNVGEGELRQIVCGAPNIKAGVNVIVALPGARIAGNYKIKKGKIRGVESLGMICSLQEIGFPEGVVPKEFADGIYYLPENATPGDEIFKYLDMDDEVLELSITPNRADALSMRGVAHEVAAIYGSDLHLQEKELVEGSEAAADKVSVAVETDKVLTYQMRVIDGVKVAPSPQWLQNLLMNEGIRPISNVVDVTNFILLYFGQPLHSFDYNKFDKGAIVARQAVEGEKITTLDGEEREMSAEDIVITADGKPVALAGVMGGLDTEIDNASTTVALEAAVFDSKSIRKTSQKFNLRSESSSRFEKGINHAAVNAALDYAAAMIAELAGGTVLAGTVADKEFVANDVTVSITLTKINSALGTSLDEAEVVRIFKQLGFEVAVDGERFDVTVPPRRWDISIEADLVEEVARIYGYDNLPTTLPAGGATVGQLTPMQKLRRRIHGLMTGAGLSEVVTYALTTADKAVEFSKLPKDKMTSLAMPMSEERTTLRLSLITGLLDTVAYNANRGNKELAIYEIGTVFPTMGDETDGRPTELPQLAFAMTGKDVDFYAAKGIVENALLGYSDVRFEADAEIAEMHPGRTAKIVVDGVEIGFVGQVHPATAKAYDIATTYVASLDMTQLLALQPAQVVFKDIPKFQAAKRDVALLVDRVVTNQDLLDVIASAKVKTLTDVTLFDVYTGENVAVDKKSMAYSLTFLNAEQQLTDEEINAAMTKISKKLEEFGAEIR